MSNISLYNISADFLNIISQLEDNGGELTPELEEALAINEANLVTKVEAYLEVIAKYKALAAEAAEREKQYAAYKRIATNVERSMRERLAYALERMGRDKVEIGMRKVSFLSSTAVNITDEASIPASYVRVETKIDKESLKRDLKAGLVIEGAELVTNKSLQIR